jgi:DNA helicase-2/ATP-dependent DNA helicase PcrA
LNEYHVYGPPGTGKTTRLQHDIARAVEVHGRDRVMVSSFTRAAATEVIDRGVPIAKNMIGTLHSLCYRGLEAPDLAELKVDEFNASGTVYRLSAHNIDVGEASEGFFGKAAGDETMGRYQVLRARMVPRVAWSEQVEGFAKQWEGWKKECGYLDFNDLIEVARDEFIGAPGGPNVMFVDEAQDLNALQFSCIRKWGARMDRLVLLGDDDQAIYTFTGADAANLLDRGIPEENKRVLRRSYRVPRAILSLANSWIHQIQHRQAKEYEPRDADGEVRRSQDGTWKHPDGIIWDIQQQIAAGKKVMALTTCAYMLNPLIAELRSHGILFHNPYRVTRGAWNPVRNVEGSTLNRVLAFLRGDLDPDWTYETFALWIELIQAKGILKHGAQKLIKELGADQERGMQRVESSEIRSFFESSGPWDSFDPWSGRKEQNLEWIARNAAAPKSKCINYIKKVVDCGNMASLYEKPRVTIGTIHSVKGGEADVVYLFPDVSREGYDNWDAGGAQRDAVIRQMYVGMTRAKETLVLPEAATGLSVEI